MKSFLFASSDTFFAYYYSPTLLNTNPTNECKTAGDRRSNQNSNKSGGKTTSNFNKVEEIPFNGWDIYSHQREFERQGMYDYCKYKSLKWRVSTMNSKYTICDSYPCLLGVPLNMHNGEGLTRAASYRSKNRMIALSWRKGALYDLENTTE